MGKCDNCRLRKESAKAFDIHWHGEDDCPYGKCPVPDFPKTNADRIRAMSVEEMALQVAEWNHGDCPPIEFCPKHRNEVTHYLECTPWKCWLDWLKQEASE